MTAATWDAYPQITNDQQAVILTDGRQDFTLTPAQADDLGNQLSYAALPRDPCHYPGCTNLQWESGYCDQHQRSAA